MTDTPQEAPGLGPVNTLPDGPYPPVGVTVRCTLRATSGTEVVADLIHVDEDDVTWRTADDNSELNEWAWDVVAWRTIPEQSNP